MAILHERSLSRGWKTGTLADICEEDRKTVRADENLHLVYLGLEQVEANSGRILAKLHAGSEDFPSGVSFLFSQKHVLYGKLRPYLNKVALPECEGCCSTELIPLKPRNDTPREFVAYALRRQEVVQAIMLKNKGARMPRADMDFLLSLPLAIPPLPEQRRIVDILSRAEGIMRLQRQAADKAREITPALFLDMFGDPATNPKGWPSSTLGELIVDGPQNGLYKPASAYGDGVPILRIDGFYDGRIVDPDSLKRLRLTPGETDKYSLHEGDIVINRVNSPEYLGKSAIVSRLKEPTVFESNMMRFAVNTKLLLPEFLIALLQTPYIRRFLVGHAKHAINQSSINQQDVMAIPVMLPALSLQKEFVSRADSLTSLATQRTLATQSGELLFQSLLHRAFSAALQQIN